MGGLWHCYAHITTDPLFFQRATLLWAASQTARGKLLPRMPRLQAAWMSISWTNCLTRLTTESTMNLFSHVFPIFNILDQYILLWTYESTKNMLRISTMKPLRSRWKPLAPLYRFPVPWFGFVHVKYRYIIYEKCIAIHVQHMKHWFMDLSENRLWKTAGLIMFHMKTACGMSKFFDKPILLLRTETSPHCWWNPDVCEKHETKPQS